MANDAGAVHFYKRGPSSWALFGIIRPAGVGGDRAGISLDADGLRSLVDVAIETGRKHQIRRHLAGL